MAHRISISVAGSAVILTEVDPIFEILGRLVKPGIVKFNFDDKIGFTSAVAQYTS